MRTLIVHNCDETRRRLQHLLQARGYPLPLVAASAREALELLEPDRTPPPGEDGIAIDVALVEADAPDGEGPELCRRMRTVPHLKDLPVLLLTGRSAEAAYELTRVLEACDFVRTPGEPPELLGRLHAACRLKRMLDDCRSHKRDLERLNSELHRLAILDELHGVANRRCFNLLLAQEWARAVREVIPLSLVLIDIDFFKKYNDHYGHQKGDECLRRVAAALAAATRRPGDLVARYGGEEFTVLLPHTELRGALAVAEALRRRVEALALEHACGQPQGRVTISLGVASTVPERRGSPDDLVAAADRAIYAAKRDGRNRTHAFLEPVGQVHGAHPTPGLPYTHPTE